ncbi:hypothetical protein KM803_15360, partial [Clostridium tyrobutyricum]|uniref:hypothetical protein n=1 Tax=Clostridium tyrobutyricum TaxID=1519 RepID=UPI001C38EDD3
KSQIIISLENEMFQKDKKNIFILAKPNIFMKNDYIMVTSLNRSDIEKELCDFDKNNIKNSKNIINKRNEVCNWIDGSHFLIPNYLYIDFNNNAFTASNKIKSILYKKNINLIIAFISNFTGTVDGKLKSIINGTKRIEVDYDCNIEYNFSYYNNMFHLYEWIYDSSTFDKINISRNVISVLVTAKCQGSVYKTILVNSDWLLKSVKDNFEVFLKNNITNYFKEKNELIEQLRKDILEINNQISELTKLSNSSVVSSIGLIVAGVISYSTKLNISLIKILCLIYIFYLDANSGFNLPSIIVRFNQSKHNFAHKKDLYINNYTEDSEIKLLDENNKISKMMFWIYIILTVALIFFLNFIALGVVYNKPYVTKILKLLGI